MAKRPNKMGRIEADPKPKRQIKWKPVAVVVVAITLVLVGVSGTLRYQQFIQDIKDEGVAEYRIDDCTKYTNEDRTAQWLECEVAEVK